MIQLHINVMYIIPTSDFSPEAGENIIFSTANILIQLKVNPFNTLIDEGGEERWPRKRGKRKKMLDTVYI